MKDIFEEMRGILKLDYISDIPFYGNKAYIKKLLENLPRDAYPAKGVKAFKKYAFQKQMNGKKALPAKRRAI